MRRLALLASTLASMSVLPAQPAPSVRSPERLVGGSIAFRLHAPAAREVLLKGQWPGGREGLPLVADDQKIWSVTVPAIPPGVWEYHYSVDGLRVIDPRNPAIKPQRAPAASVLHLPATPPAPRDWQSGIPHGALHRHEYPSADSARPRAAVVYTPPGYDPVAGRLYPLLVLQHGSGDTERSWTEHGKAHWILDHLIHTGAAEPMVVLMIDGHSLAAPGENRQAAFRRELIEDALPLVERHYRVLPGPENRALVGLSMGGGQALRLAFAEPERFGWIGALSAATPEPREWGRVLADAESAERRLLWIACGGEDFLLERNIAFVETLRDRGVRHEWRQTPGDHSWPVWREHLAELLPRLFR